MCFPMAALAGIEVQYRTIRGDTLSDIVWALVPGRLYGKNGNLKKVSKLNPWIKKPEHLEKGSIVILPDGSHYVVGQVNQFGPEHVSPNFKNENEVLSRMRFLSDVPEERLTSTEVPKPVATQNRKPASPIPEVVPPQLKPEVVVTETPKPIPSPVAVCIPEVQAKKTEVALAKADDKKEFSRGAWLEFTPTYKMTGLSLLDPSTGSRSNLVTQYYFSTEVLYVQKLAKQFETFIGLNLGYVSFASPKATTKSVSDSSHFLSGIELGGSGEVAPNLTFTGDLRYNNELFGRASSTTSVSVDAVPVPSVEGKLSWDAIHFNPFIYGLSGMYTAYFATQSDSTYTISQGSGYGGSIYIKQSRSTNTPPFETHAGFFSRTQNTSSINQKETTYFLNVRFYIPFLSEEGERMK